MRLWPLSILSQLPRQQLLGQHRECCALRGKGWGRKHATVDYVFSHPREWLYEYHMFVIAECLLRRHYRIDPKWIHPNYCGKNLPKSNTPDLGEYESLFSPGDAVYPEHDDAYLDECIANLARKGVKITYPNKEKAA